MMHTVGLHAVGLMEVGQELGVDVDMHVGSSSGRHIHRSSHDHSQRRVLSALRAS